MTKIEEKIELLFNYYQNGLEISETSLLDLLDSIPLIDKNEEVTNIFCFEVLIHEIRTMPRIITPLLQAISLSDKDNTFFMYLIYASIFWLENYSENYEFNIPEKLVVRLGVWLLEGFGEITYVSAKLLNFFKLEAVEEMLLKKMGSYDDYYGTYIECLSGLLYYNKDKYFPLVKQIAKDERRNIFLREFCDEIILKYN